MKTTSLLSFMLYGALATACSHDHDGKEWTKEELQELEDKWGNDVSDWACILYQQNEKSKLTLP